MRPEAWTRPAPGARLYGLPGLALLCAMAPHVTVVPLWLAAVFIATGLWRLGAEARDWALPNRWLLAAATVALCGAIGWQYRTLFGREAGVALLYAMTSLKLLEWRVHGGQRDALVLMLLGYLLVMARMLYDQGPVTALWALASVALTLAAQVRVASDGGGPPVAAVARLVGGLLARAVPLALVLFVLFPRVPGPLWSLPQDAAARTGVGEDMSPGTIAELSRSDAVAFRVRFTGGLPAADRRYWRGPVLDRYDGRTWRMSEELPGQHFPQTEASQALSYVVTLEPSGRRWLYALDLPDSLPAQTGVTASGMLMRRSAVTEVVRYEQRSVLEYRTGPLTSWERSRALRLPSTAAPRAQALGREWRTRFADPAERVQAALTMFRREPFRYTLSPPLTPTDAVDEFLFDTRAGFCEHYAGAFVALMRAAEVPARVVTGYLGGEPSPGGDYFIVRQSDAHAWAEVWLEGRGWTRIDPTAAIAPERVERGTASAIPDPDSLSLLSRRGESWLASALLKLDALEYAWNEWVLAYGPDRQRELLGWLLGWRDIDWRGLILLLVSALAIVGLALALLNRRSRRQGRDPLGRSYARFCARLAAIGLARQASEGPLSYRARIARLRPDLADATGQILVRYAELRFGEHPDPQRLRELNAQLRRFRPRA
ncbi:DUF3488 and transglutaminase-like domain-containing protein [Plasticicumulans sp.]|uniref:transglutaminase TgpA family protein n=1 Tax=Plasticicumulans sp. TaxID=2307179 RepID=UPI002CB9BB50|nr:DUF3488 and transglutaminase-like domain-containing protein [Plasticicumulans sp.]HNM43628.1 DUF3488 and transglutaminase-like domain-containing protein [Plasticicumulans sp.]